MIKATSCLLVVAAALLCSCSSSSSNRNLLSKKGTRITSVRTTAYTHSESDHIQYGARTAVGTQLRYGSLVRSAAADWSVYPVGTIFQIEGTPYIYQVDDYGSALVGTNTIDIYQPTKAHMNAWGVRNVNIRVLRWGSRSKSLAIMKERQKYDHVRKMVQRLERS
ncbi:3D (Asp-Asp-Asp) domain-containing protein [Prosthecobacter debontii]|uniref:3D (Asp-Asp-Asp) domain-containing protein n=1 Tax=Prosthecobacter debontii TaxID=48467 RepID=A0A1T4XT01_9BACT|nr:3D domain-containing protein [Prosthecobacter debontii]SKA92670.1 3D (Asp-Asp-Asp) domain-containing protein [Prosthecobacter debontii]